MVGIIRKNLLPRQQVLACIISLRYNDEELFML